MCWNRFTHVKVLNMLTERWLKVFHLIVAFWYLQNGYLAGGGGFSSSSSADVNFLASRAFLSLFNRPGSAPELQNAQQKYVMLNFIYIYIIMHGGDMIHVSLNWQQGKFQLWAICFMSRKPISIRAYQIHLSPTLAVAVVLTTRPCANWIESHTHTPITRASRLRAETILHGATCRYYTRMSFSGQVDAKKLAECMILWNHVQSILFRWVIKFYTIAFTHSLKYSALLLKLGSHRTVLNHQQKLCWLHT